MHGYSWQLGFFLTLAAYGYVIPVVLVWAAMLYFKLANVALMLVIGTIIHVFALYWIYTAHNDLVMLATGVCVFICYVLILRHQDRKRKHQGDLYVHDIKVVQPNELKR